MHWSTCCARPRESGRAALAATPELLPVLKEAGVVDAGGAGFLLLLDAALHVVDGEALPEPDEHAGSRAGAVSLAVQVRAAHDGGAVHVSELRYEVMYFLDLVDDQIEAFKHGWGAIGDSIVVVGGEGLWNCHVHTNDIGAALEVALDVGGRPRQIRVTDLFEEVADEHAVREAALLAGGPHRHGSSLLPPVTCAVVAVASGDGLGELFGQLGVQGVITGGQTLNPSTAELLDAVEAGQRRRGHRPAEQQEHHPRRRAARRAQRQAGGGRTDHLDAGGARRTRRLRPRAERGGQRQGDGRGGRRGGHRRGHPGGARHRPATSGRSRRATGSVWSAATASSRSPPRSTSVIRDLLDHLIGSGGELLTVVEGAGSSMAHTAELCGWVAEHRPGVEVEVHRGGQPLYPYLFGVE